MDCKDFGERLLLFLYDDLPPEERAACAAHLAACERCRGGLDEASRLHQLLSQRRAAEPSPQLLVQCRQALDDALDRKLAVTSWRGRIPRWVTALGGEAPPRALALLTLVLFGFGLGWTLRSRAPGFLPEVTRGVPSSFAAADLAHSRISGISQVTPNPQTGEVRITLDAERRVTLEGSLDDPRIQQLLVNAVKNYDNPGIRRDTLDALRARRDSPNVRQALLFAMRRDPNPGVRLEALGAVQGLDWSPDLRQAYLESLKHDANEGVRVAAINVLLRHADEEVLPALQQLAASDPNPYVRLKCASAVRELGDDDF